MGRYLKELSADAGYFSEANLKWVNRKTDAYIPGQKIKHHDEPQSAPRGRIPVDMPLPDLMKLNSKAGRAKYALRKQIVERVVKSRKSEGSDDSNSAVWSKFVVSGYWFA